MITGLSLSFCISSICRGEVKEEEVEKIITGIRAPSKKIFNEVLQDYAKTYWHDFPKKATQIAILFWNKNKIDQPRLRGEMPFFVGDGPWMDEERKTFHFVQGQRKYSGQKAKGC